MPKSINMSQQTSPVPDAALRRLAVLGRVPDAQHELFFEFVGTLVQTACERDEIVKQGRTTKNGTALQRASLALFELLNNLSKDELEFIEKIFGGKSKSIFDRISGGGVFGLAQTAYQFALLFSHMTGKPLPRFPRKAPQPHRRGPKPGTVKDLVYQEFVFELLLSATLAGGRLTNDKNENYGPGTLIEAIKILVPHLPTGFVPKKFSGSKLQRLKVWCRDFQREANDFTR
jgi:hypothetical protein